MKLQINNFIKMASEEDNFFATQIAQQSQQPEENQKPQQDKKEDKRHQQQPPKQSPTKKTQTHDNSLKGLLTAFNTYDKQEKGVITLEEAKQILTARQIPTDKFDVHYKMSLPIEPNHIAFDEFLFVFGLCENTSTHIQDKYMLCKKVDQRLIQFLRLLNNYRKKSEGQHNYKQAKKSKSKIQQIRERELERRKNYLNILHDHEINDLEEKQRIHFMDFCNTWDNFMMDYQKTAADLIQKLQAKHEAQIIEFTEKTRQELAAKIHYSKNILQLQTKQKNLVKLQEYEQANLIHEQVERQKRRQQAKKQKSDEEVIEIRCTGVRKQQVTAVNNLLQNIQKDRNDQMKQRKTDSEKLIVRNRSLITELNHKHMEAIKKIYEALHNISLENSTKS